eukprot:scaffold526_cov108-Isochrysis_galbana.AAC.2
MRRHRERVWVWECRFPPSAFLCLAPARPSLRRLHSDPLTSLVMVAPVWGTIVFSPRAHRAEVVVAPERRPVFLRRLAGSAVRRPLVPSRVVVVRPRGLGRTAALGQLLLDLAADGHGQPGYGRGHRRGKGRGAVACGRGVTPRRAALLHRAGRAGPHQLREQIADETTHCRDLSSLAQLRNRLLVVQERVQPRKETLGLTDIAQIEEADGADVGRVLVVDQPVDLPTGQLGKCAGGWG